MMQIGSLLLLKSTHRVYVSDEIVNKAFHQSNSKRKVNANIKIVMANLLASAAGNSKKFLDWKDICIIMQRCTRAQIVWEFLISKGLEEEMWN